LCIFSIDRMHIRHAAPKQDQLKWASPSWISAPRCTASRTVEVGLSPTYSGCPATEVIRERVRDALVAAGLEARVVEVLAPPWTSDWLTARGRERLAQYGIAPPAESVTSPRALTRRAALVCPRCASERTERLSEFASTPCKALYRCADCREPFEYFKCI